MQPGITLEPGKQYMPYISLDTPNSLPIVQMFGRYNPIHISIGNPIDASPHFISLAEEPHPFYYDDLARMVLASEQTTALFDALHEHQGEVWVKMFRNHPAFQPLFDQPHVKSLGFSPQQAHQLNNKIFQYDLLQNLVPLPAFAVTNKQDALDHFERLRTPYGVFTSLAYGGGGSGTRIHKTKDSLVQYLDEIGDQDFIIAAALQLKNSPSIDVLVANENEIFIYGLADQIFDGLSCLGCVYPSDLEPHVQERARDIAYAVAKKVAQQGIRGHFGIDLLVDEDDQMYFCEINGRYTGNTANRIWAMEQSRPSGHPHIIDLEVMAVKEGTFNGHTLWDEPEGLHWYKREIRSEEDGVTRALSIFNDLRMIYKHREGMVLVGQLPAGMPVVRKKTVLGNIVAVQKSRDALKTLITYSEDVIKDYIAFGSMVA